MSSNPESLLDADFFANWGHYVSRESEILWEGRPKKEFSVRWLEGGVYYDVATGPVNYLYIILGFFVTFAAAFFYVKWMIAGSIAVFLGLCVLILPNAYASYQRKNTRYAFTKDLILFKLIEWGQPKIYAIPFSDILKITYQEYEDKSGILHLMLRNKAPFRTYNFATGDMRVHPTLEGIPNVIEVFQKMESVRKANVGKKPLLPIQSCQAPLIDRSDWKVRLLISFQTVVISLFSLYMIDFFLLPPKIIEDHLAGYGVVDYTYRGYEREVGGNYRTQKGLRFGTQGFAYPEFKEEELHLLHTPIFRSVKDLVIRERSYRHALCSDLNGVTQYFHYATFLVLLGGTWVIGRKKRLTPELFWQITISSLVFLAISIYLWVLFN